MMKGKASRSRTILSVAVFTVVACFGSSFAAAPKSRWYRDLDGDGYGDANVWQDKVNQPRNYVADNTDCDDNSATVYPGAAEAWNDGIDQNCDGHDSLTFASVFGWNADGGTAIQQTNDGGYIVLGTEPDYGTYTFFLAKLDRAGSVQWSNHYGDRSHAFGNSVKQTADGGYVMVGYTSTATNGSVAYVVKTDSLGGVQWTQSIGDPDHYYYGEQVIQTPDGGYAVKAQVRPVGGYVSQTCLAKLDSDGTPVWSRTYAQGYAAGVDLLSDGGFVLLGTNYSALNLLRVDENGNELWSQDYPGFAYGEGVRQTADGGFAILSFTYEPGGQTYDFFLTKTDALGSAQWTKAFGYPAFHDECYGFDLTSDGGFIMTGYTFLNSHYPDILLVRADANGNELWKTIMPSDLDRTEMSFSVCETDDGGFALSGRTTSEITYGSVGTLVIKTDQYGSITP